MTLASRVPWIEWTRQWPGSSLAIDGRVAAFVEAFVAVGDVAGGTAHAAIVAADLPSLDGVVAAQALVADVGERGQLGILVQFATGSVGASGKRFVCGRRTPAVRAARRRSM